MAENDRRHSRLQEVSTLVEGLLQSSKSPLSQQFLRWKVWRNWPEIVGEEISKHSMPVDYKPSGRLYIWVDSSARLQEMSFLLKQIAEKINKFVGRGEHNKWVKSIYLTLDRKYVPTPETADENYNKIIR